MTSIKARDIRKTFSDVIAVDNVDFTVEDGEFVTLVGPSGCGKTTTLRLLAGLEVPDEGEILFGEKDVTQVPGKHRNVGFVFQNLALYPHMSVRGNMEFGLKLAGVDESERTRRVENVAGMLDIGDLLDRKPENLSGGQQQRVAIGRTLSLNPDVFLLDEPLASLDAKLKVEIREELQQLQQDVGITTIYVTHDQQQAMTMSDRIAVMNEGRVVQFDTPEETYENPANEFVANFIGTPAMNFIEGDLSRHPDDENLLAVDLGGTSVTIQADGMQTDPSQVSSVTLGIRPENVKLVTENTTENTFTVPLRFYEPTGREKIGHFGTESLDITVLVDQDQELRKGETYDLHFPAEHVLLFDNTRDSDGWGSRIY